VEVDGCLEVLSVAEAADHALNLLNLAIESCAHCVGDWMLAVGQDVADVSTNRLGRFANWLQRAVCRPEVIRIGSVGSQTWKVLTTQEERE